MNVKELREFLNELKEVKEEGSLDPNSCAFNRRLITLKIENTDGETFEMDCSHLIYNIVGNDIIFRGYNTAKGSQKIYFAELHHMFKIMPEVYGVTEAFPTDKEGEEAIEYRRERSEELEVYFNVRTERYSSKKTLCSLERVGLEFPKGKTEGAIGDIVFYLKVRS